MNGELVLHDSIRPVVKPATYRWVHFSILAVALLLRCLIFPHVDETRDIDEAGYLKGSLALLEGLPPGYKAAPAGPNFWLGWAYTGGVAAYHLFSPGPEERQVSIQVRPFVAIEHALFDQYRDLHRLRLLWISTQLILAMLATSTAYRMGLSRAGLAGGVLLGGFVATLPLFVDFTMMSRPYMTAWCFGILALGSAMLCTGRWRVVLSGVLLGLAVSSRIEMLLTVPLVLWEFWYRRELHEGVAYARMHPSLEAGDVLLPTAESLAAAQRSLIGVWARVVGISAIVALLAAPWLLTHLIGNLRTIATVRLGPDPHGGTTLVGNLRELAWNQALGGAMIAFVISIIALFVPGTFGTELFRTPRRFDRLRVAVLGVYIAVLLASLGRGTVFLHQQGPVVLALVFFGPFAAALINRISSRFAVYFAVILLLVPLFKTASMIIGYHRNYAPDHSVEWVSKHVPPGTIVYTQATLQQLLPTAACAKAAWDDVTDDQAWRRKFMAGASRFDVAVDCLPPALSEENLIQERGNRRGFFILGGRAGLPEPRFDERNYNGSPVFDLHDVLAAFDKTGGVLVWYGTAREDLGKPLVSWTNTSGSGTFIYCSPDVHPLIKPD